MNLEVAVDAFLPDANIGRKNAIFLKNSVSLHSQFTTQLNVTKETELFGNI